MSPPGSRRMSSYDTASCTTPQGKSSGKEGCAGKLNGKKHETYATEMAMLAHVLVSIAQRHGFGLHVGIHAGSAAGAVIGKVRAFYCIYGETVNTASRLCRYSNAGQIHGSLGFVTCLDVERAARTPDENAALPHIAWHSRGHTRLKGFDHTIETFTVSVHREWEGAKAAGGEGGEGVSRGGGGG